MIFHKGTDSHDYKYGAAIWEECLAVAESRVARPACRRGDVQSSRCQDARQPAHDPGSRGGGKSHGLKQVASGE